MQFFEMLKFCLNFVLACHFVPLPRSMSFMIDVLAGVTLPATVIIKIDDGSKLDTL